MRLTDFWGDEVDEYGNCDDDAHADSDTDADRFADADAVVLTEADAEALPSDADTFETGHDAFSDTDAA